MIKKLMLSVLFFGFMLSPLWANPTEIIQDEEVEIADSGSEELTEGDTLSDEEKEAMAIDEEAASDLATQEGLLTEKDLIPAPKIPLYSNQKIERFIDMYTGRKRDQFEQAVQRSAKYMPMIKKIFAEYDLPPNLAYLAVVESNLNPKARSHANAVGMWQFMRYTGRVFDLHNSWWHDDRYDPEKSTHAAAKYLRNLYREFGEWELALAAYNAGGGRVRRALKEAKRKDGNADYWALRLPRETRGYVPSFYAVCIIFENLESYGFQVPQEEEAMKPREWVEVPGGLSLEAIAKSMEIDPEHLQEINPAMARGITPANFYTIPLAVPPGMRPDMAKLEELAKNRERFWKYHRVRQGDTLSGISRRYGLPMSQVMAFNNLSKRSRLRIGQEIMLPVASGYDPNRPQVSQNEKPLEGMSYYRVQEGDTFFSIAQRHNTTVDKLKSWNPDLSSQRYLPVGAKVALVNNEVSL